jgi:hypothetical protein
VRPGVYRWRVSLHDDSGLVDIWDAIPEMVIATEPLAHREDERAGILNVSSSLSVRHSEEVGSSR